MDGIKRPIVQNPAHPVHWFYGGSGEIPIECPIQS